MREPHTIPTATERRTRGRRVPPGITDGMDVYTPDELEFLKAMDRYKRDNRRPWPTWSEVLAVLRSLGYRKVAEAGPPVTIIRGTGMPGRARTEVT
jgi:hypothetical protein